MKIKKKQCNLFIRCRRREANEKEGRHKRKTAKEKKNNDPGILRRWFPEIKKKSAALCAATSNESEMNIPLQTVYASLAKHRDGESENEEATKDNQIHNNNMEAEPT